MSIARGSDVVHDTYFVCLRHISNCRVEPHYLTELVSLARGDMIDKRSPGIESRKFHST